MLLARTLSQRRGWQIGTRILFRPACPAFRNIVDKDGRIHDPEMTKGSPGKGLRYRWHDPVMRAGTLPGAWCVPGNLIRLIPAEGLVRTIGIPLLAPAAEGHAHKGA